MNIFQLLLCNNIQLLTWHWLHHCIRLIWSFARFSIIKCAPVKWIGIGIQAEWKQKRYRVRIAMWARLIGWHHVSLFDGLSELNYDWNSWNNDVARSPRVIANLKSKSSENQTSKPNFSFSIKWQSCATQHCPTPQYNGTLFLCFQQSTMSSRCSRCPACRLPKVKERAAAATFNTEKYKNANKTSSTPRPYVPAAANAIYTRTHFCLFVNH